MTIKEIAKEFLGTTEKQSYDEWRELKAFLGGCFITSVIWAILWVSLNAR